MPGDLLTAVDPAPRRGGRAAAVAVSLAAHAAVVAALLWAPRTPAVRPAAPEPVFAVFAPSAPPLTPAPGLDEHDLDEPAASAPAATPAPVPRLSPLRPRPAPAAATTVPAAAGPVAGPRAGEGLSDGQLAGAALAGSGGARGGCDMALRLQAALRKDARVRAALAGRGATLVWDGDWTTTSGEEGRGLAAVREAVIWEIGFAPAACREEPVSGLVLLSLDEGAGAPRIALGAGAWRWTDLLHPRRR